MATKIIYDDKIYVEQMKIYVENLKQKYHFASTTFISTNPLPKLIWH